MVGLVQVSFKGAVESKVVVGIGHELDVGLVVGVLLERLGAPQIKAVELLLVETVLGIGSSQEREVLAA